VTGGWRNLHNEKLHDLLGRLFKPMRMSRAGRVTRMGEMIGKKF